MTFGSVCSGIEAASVAWKPLGWMPAFYSEIEPFPCAVLKERHNETPNLGDMTKFKDWPDYAIDVLIGGTPCQSFSVAGLRKGLADPRGNLALTFLAIVARYRPEWVVWENVPGVHSSWSDVETYSASEESKAVIESACRALAAAGLDLGADFRVGQFEEADQSNDFDCFAAGLEELGYGVATRILDAQYFDLAQRRERVFVVGHSGGCWQCAAAVLFERESLCGNPPPRREAGKRVAGTFSARTDGGGGLGTDFDLDDGLTLARCVTTGEGSRLDGESCTFVTHTLKGEGHDASEDGTGRGVPLVTAFSVKDHGADAQEDISPTLRAGGHDGSHANGGVMPAVCIEYDVAGTQREGRPGHTNNLRVGNSVRRLTPRECERLQGFPDDYTRIQWRGKAAEDCPDGPRYKAIGNSMAVPVIKWIGERIAKVSSTQPANSPAKGSAE